MTDFISADMAPLVALGLLVVMLAAFIWEKYPPEVTAAVAAGVFIVLGLTPTDQVLGAFSNEAPITIAAMFVLSGALVRTGLLEALSNGIVGLAEKRPMMAAAAFVTATVVGSAFVNNTPVVLVLIPVVIRLAQSLDMAPTRLLIPLSYVAIMGGTLTLIGTSTNILISGVATQQGLEPFGIFEIAPVGAVVVGTGLVALLVLGPLLLPARGGDTDGEDERNTTYLTEVRVTDKFTGIDKPVPEIGTFGHAGVQVTGIRQGGTLRRDNLADHVLKVGDEVILRATMSELLTLHAATGLVVGYRRGAAPTGVSDGDLMVAEAVVTAGRRGGSQTLDQMSLGTRHGMRVLGAHRHGHQIGPDLRTVTLRAADSLLLEGTPSAFQQLSSAGDLMTVSLSQGRAYRRARAPLALVSLLAVIGLAAFNVAPIAVLALVAVAFILLMRCIDSDEAWGAIDAQIIVLIFAMLIVGIGLQQTGAVQLIVETLAPFLDGLPPILLLAALYAVTSILTEMVTNSAVAVILTPIAVGLATQAGFDPRPFVVAVMFGASASFATPIGYQTNTLVYGAGDYRFSDFLKIGIPMNVIVGAASVLAIPLFFPF
ncbi:Citrate transporter [Loktanella fryxellensis]|uniref:Citrate transporter n=1 Tax=Loktanella fryxellensis TaxID=245187 RepID=A0A1H7ZVG3_9RHOB|nr:SLC13 family permease [Loktanella fryxellensis]SEM62440.1 Citrate transporter [Loktanella fryxellensis]